MSLSLSPLGVTVSDTTAAVVTHCANFGRGANKVHAELEGALEAAVHEHDHGERIGLMRFILTSSPQQRMYLSRLVVLQIPTQPFFYLFTGQCIIKLQSEE